MKKVIKKTASSRKPVEPPRGFIKPNMPKKPMMKSGGAKKSLPKAQPGKTIKDRWGRSPGDKWYGFNPESKKYESVYKPELEKNYGKTYRANEKERIDFGPNNTYLADKKGNVGSYTYYPSGTMSGTTIDTTGYSKGKTSFPKTTVFPNKTYETTVSRKEAMDEVKKMKQNALNKRKKGGAVKKATAKKPMMNDGGLFKKMRNNILENREKKAYSKYSQARSSGSDDTAKLYDKLLKRQTKSINAGVNVKYKKGGATKTTAKKQR